MQGSINFDGSLVGNITGGGGGGGDEIIITPVVTSGTKIADVSVNGVEKDLYCPNPTAVSVTQVQQSGTKIATIGVNGVNTDIYTPEGGGSDVEITPVVTSGTKIADVSVGGVEKDLYAPNYGADITALDGRLDTAEGNITNLAGHMTEAETDITQIKQSLSDFEILEKTASGDIVSFDDGSDLPMPKLEVAIEPVQSGSGDPSPTNVRPISGWDEVNVSDINDSTKAPFFRGLLNGTYNFNDLGSLTWYKSNETFYTYLSEHKVVAGNSPIKAISSNGMEFLQMPGSGNAEFIMITDSDYASYTAAQFRMAMNGVYLIYELATPTTPTITAEQMNTLLTAFNINGHTYTIDLDGTRYGGTLDMVSGLLTITDGYIASYNSETLPSTWISDRDVYAEGTTPTVGAEVVYKLATPQTIQLTPTQVKSLLGQNNVWADTGDIELTYLTNNPLTQTVYDMVKILVEQST